MRIAGTLSRWPRACAPYAPPRASGAHRSISTTCIGATGGACSKRAASVVPQNPAPTTATVFIPGPVIDHARAARRRPARPHDRKPGAPRPRSTLAHHHEPQLRHVLDRIADALAAEARVLHAAVGHVVDAERRHVVDHDAADLQLVPRALGMRERIGEHAGLQPEVAVVHARERLVEIAEAFEDRDRPERFLAIQ